LHPSSPPLRRITLHVSQQGQVFVRHVVGLWVWPLPWPRLALRLGSWQQR